MSHAGCHSIDLKGTDGKYWYGGFILFGKVWSSLVKFYMEEKKKKKKRRRRRRRRKDMW